MTGKSLSRRTVLRGAGAALALPFLDAMVPTFSRARAATKPVSRFLAFYTPNGMAMEYWTPKGTGTNFEIPPILEPLKAHKDKLLMFTGLKASWNYIHAGAKRGQDLQDGLVGVCFHGVADECRHPGKSFAKDFKMTR